MIEESYVSFEVAKLLKEKGFDEYCGYYSSDGEYWGYCVYNHKGKDYISAPTLQMTMKWLREKHNIHIAVIVAYHHIPRRYEAHIMKIENIDDFILNRQIDFASYEEACESAIRYCLEKLI